MLVIQEVQEVQVAQVTPVLQVTQVLPQLLLAKRSRVGQEVMEGQEVQGAQRAMEVPEVHRGQVVILEAPVHLAIPLQLEGQEVPQFQAQVVVRVKGHGFHVFSTLTFLVTMVMQ